MLSEINQTEKDKYHVISLLCEIQKQKTKQTHRKRVARGWGVGKMDGSVQKVQTSSYKKTKSWGFNV